MDTLEVAEGRSLTAAELVSVLRSAIMGGELVPDQRLVEADLAAWYMASRGKVRAALAELTVEGLVERVQNRGARVRAVSVQEAVERGDRDSYSEGNRTLHATLIELSGQQTAAATIHRLRGQAVRFQFRLARQPGRPAVSLPQHLAIIDAVCAHDPDAAADAMRVHLESVAKAIRSTHA